VCGGRRSPGRAPRRVVRRPGTPSSRLSPNGKWAKENRQLPEPTQYSDSSDSKKPGLLGPHPPGSGDTIPNSGVVAEPGGVRGTPYLIPALWLSRATERDSMLARPPSSRNPRMVSPESRMVSPESDFLLSGSVAVGLETLKDGRIDDCQ
jgi:hypothetical protein